MNELVIRAIVGIYGRAFRTGYRAWQVYADARRSLLGG